MAQDIAPAEGITRFLDFAVRTGHNTRQVDIHGASHIVVGCPPCYRANTVRSADN